jgi:hypothetical protein
MRGAHAPRVHISVPAPKRLRQNKQRLKTRKSSRSRGRDRLYAWRVRSPERNRCVITALTETFLDSASIEVIQGELDGADF